MATRTEPIALAPSLICLGQFLPLVFRYGSPAAAGPFPFGGGRGASLGVDQLVEPAHFALDRLQPVALEFEGVTVQPVPRPGESRADPLEPFLQTAAPAFEDPQPYVGIGVPEEREVDPEAL